MLKLNTSVVGPVLEIRRGNMGCRDGSFERSQHTFWMRKKKNYLQITCIHNTPSYLEL